MPGHDLISLAPVAAVVAVVPLGVPSKRRDGHCPSLGFPPTSRFLAAEASHFDGKSVKKVVEENN